MMKLDSLEKRRVLNFAAYLLGCTDMQKGHMRLPFSWNSPNKLRSSKELVEIRERSEKWGWVVGGEICGDFFFFFVLSSATRACGAASANLAYDLRIKVKLTAHTPRGRRH